MSGCLPTHLCSHRGFLGIFVSSFLSFLSLFGTLLIQHSCFVVVHLPALSFIYLVLSCPVLSSAIIRRGV
ncbi:hypothetical protein BZA05DRAFT_381011 [Tricharina praecox]|uniref:uncharacterized protein n=1 Tax=Tricharina praecox TaxID=43433 RepID=UPI00221F74F3|nr:uncharacterized protein BZA05DRAFT_381011 [Tricharina praecox]KAI5858383.1 hypothetical protein BZA05DRAFT_381011 [Tricharina praecox]